MMTEVHILEVYFINNGNFAGMYDAAQNGDTAAQRVWLAIKNYLIHDPSRDCAFCEEPMSGEITFVILMKQDGMSLTTVICEDCFDHDDIDARIETVIRQWMPDTEFSHVIVNDSATRH
jgi:hypothetical protein